MFSGQINTAPYAGRQHGHLNYLTLNIRINYNEQLQRFGLLARNVNLIMHGYGPLSGNPWVSLSPTMKCSSCHHALKNKGSWGFCVKGSASAYYLFFFFIWKTFYGKSIYLVVLGDFIWHKHLFPLSGGRIKDQLCAMDNACSFHFSFCRI